MSSLMCLDFLVSWGVSPMTRLDSTSDTLCQSSSWSQANFDFSTFFIFEEKYCNTIVSDGRKTWTWNSCWCIHIIITKTMHCQHLSQLLDDIMDLQTQNPRKYVKHLRFSGQILFCKIFPKKRIGHSMFAQERGASIQILMFVFLFCNSSKRKRLFSPAKNSASKCQHNSLWASRETKAESSIFLVIAQRVKHFLL